MQEVEHEDTRLPDPRNFTFGIGRRRCPGAPIANAAIYLAVTGVLAVYSIEPAPEEGSKLELPFEFTKSTIS
jgi:cytochrome P450